MGTPENFHAALDEFANTMTEAIEKLRTYGGDMQRMVDSQPQALQAGIPARAQRNMPPVRHDPRQPEATGDEPLDEDSSPLRQREA